MGLGVFTFVLLMSTAVLVFGAAPRRFQNRALSLLLFLSALFAIGELYRLVPDPTVGAAVRNTAYSAYVASPFAYLLFMSTVASPLVRPLRTWPARAVLLALIPIVLLGWPLIRPYFFGPTGYGPAYNAFSVAVAGVALLGLAVAISAYLRTPPGGLSRAQAKAYVYAFGARDIILGGLLIGYQFDIWGHWGVWLYPAVFLSDILFGVFVTYGALKTQLFDIDLKIKWTINRGTLAAIFVASFFVASELMAALLSDRIGLVLGVLVTGVLVFLLAPLQRFADRVSDRAMPHVIDNTEYRTVRKQQVYRAALESALLDGTVSGRERDVLATLADELGLTARQVLEVERAHGTGSE